MMMTTIIQTVLLFVKDQYWGYPSFLLLSGRDIQLYLYYLVSTALFNIPMMLTTVQLSCQVARV